MAQPAKRRSLESGRTRPAAAWRGRVLFMVRQHPGPAAAGLKGALLLLLPGLLPVATGISLADRRHQSAEQSSENILLNESSKASSALEVAVQDGMIPEWRLNMFNDKPTMPPQGGSPVEIQGMPSFTSTKGQDQGRCPLLKLPASLNLYAWDSGWLRQTGSWTGASDVTFGRWSQEFLSRDWRTLYVRNTLDGRESFEASFDSDNRLNFLYGWSAASAGNVMKTDVAVLDCDKKLAFVIRLEDRWDTPVSIYSKDGRMLAICYADPTYEWLQFADPQTNYRIASAKAPGLGVNVSRDSLVRDPARSKILPYGITFEAGGYTNSSRFLEEEYRWVIVAAVQIKAIYDAERGMSVPLAARVVPPIELILIVASLLVAGVIVLALFVIYKMVTVDEVNRVTSAMVSAGDVLAQKMDRRLAFKYLP